MRGVIYKYQLNDLGVTEFKWPPGSKVLKFDFQNNYPTIWVLHDLEYRALPGLPRKFMIVGTGMEFVSPSQNYIGTAFEGIFVWHLFEVTDE